MRDRVRLRLTGEIDAAELPIASAPIALDRCVAVVAAHGALDIAPFARALRAALGGRLVRAVVRAREGSEIVEGGDETLVRASAGALEAAIESLGAIEGVLIGAAFVALRRPRSAILITGGASPAQWDPSIRALRERFDLVLEEPRAGLPGALAACLAGAR